MSNYSFYQIIRNLNSLTSWECCLEASHSLYIFKEIYNTYGPVLMAYRNGNKDKWYINEIIKSKDRYWMVKGKWAHNIQRIETYKYEEKHR